MKMRKIARRFLPPILLEWGHRILRRDGYVGLNQLDRKLSQYLDFEGGFFVELGANDGINQSNTFYYEKKRGWHGVLVEPTPHNYMKCVENRSSKNHIYCAACVGFDYQEKFVEIVYSNLMSSALGIESDMPDPLAHAQFGEKFLGGQSKVFTFGALAKTLNQLLEQSNAPRLIDLLSLDVEGAELGVLKGIDHSEFRFKYMLIECRNFEKIDRYLTDHGYRMVEKLSGHDYLFSSL